MAVVCVLFFTQGTSAQSKMSVSVGPEIAFPTGDLTQTNEFGYGGSATFHYSLIEKKLDLTGSVGYIAFAGKNLASAFIGIPVFVVNSPTISVLPIRLGANFYPIDDNGFYLGAEIGVSLFTIHSAKQTVFGATVETPSSNKTTLGLAPRIGYSIPVGNNEIDISVRYDLSPGFPSTETKTDPVTNEQVDVPTTTTLGFVGIRASYRFNLGK